ncbi:chloroplastic import inner membrane translocase subunit HP30-2-like [Papaver somniferum]|uniref:chloroplastic import inner membrane translocase subunit HP30-2-like n=1 Tax=Papaver somniferum TaxID=3469 RepID=UPI000E6FBB98|nr:chloroplastic import inner membrane translocase subunit HP30-2-like [Papaver somniferum]
MVLTPPPKVNPITVLQTKYEELDNGLRGWLAKHESSLPVVAITSSIKGAAVGGIAGGFMGILFRNNASSVLPPYSCRRLNYQGMVSFQKSQQALRCGPLIQARNFAMMNAINTGMYSVLERIRGKEDVQGSMVAGFCGGVMLSIVSSGMGGPKMATEAVKSGIFYALVQGGVYQLLGGPKFFSQPPVEKKKS